MAAVWAATRDASWYNVPDVRSVKRYHVASDGWQSECNGQPLDEGSRVPLAEVPENQRCRRGGCRLRWAAAAQEAQAGGARV